MKKVIALFNFLILLHAAQAQPSADTTEKLIAQKENEPSKGFFIELKGCSVGDAFKQIEKISEPDYSKIKKAILNLLDNAAKWGGDVTHLAVLGESAGGNLAVATSIYAREKGWPMPDHIVAVYPIANTSETLPSRTDSAQAKPLNTAALNWFGYYYMRTKADAQDPRLNLVAAKLAGLPATTIINAQADPLRSDGETLADAMRKAGVSVEQRTFPGTTHEFFGMDKVVKAAREAQDYAITRIRASLK